MPSIPTKALLQKMRFLEWLSTGPNLSGCDYDVIIRILSAYNPKRGYAFPSLDTIALNLGKTKRQVTRTIARLERRGILTVSHSTGRGNANEYRPAFDRVPDGHAYAGKAAEKENTDGRFSESIKGVNSVPLSRMDGEPERGSILAERGSILAIKGVRIDTPNEVLNGLKRKRSLASASTNADALIFSIQNEEKKNTTTETATLLRKAEEAIKNEGLTREQAQTIRAWLDDVMDEHGDPLTGWANRLADDLFEVTHDP